jgi:hypothetical protein
MGRAAVKHNFGKKIDSLSVNDYDLLQIARVTIDNPALAAAAALKASTVCGIAATTLIPTAQPDVARNVTLTSGGTAGDIKAVQAVVHGTNINDEVISETMPVFTENNATTVVGLKAFKTVTSVVVPAMDGVAAEVAINTGAKLGIPYKMSYATDVLKCYFAGSVETLAAQTVSATVLESNTVTTTTALDGAKDLVIDLLVK